VNYKIKWALFEKVPIISCGEPELHEAAEESRLIIKSYNSDIKIIKP